MLYLKKFWQIACLVATVLLHASCGTADAPKAVTQAPPPAENTASLPKLRQDLSELPLGRQVLLGGAALTRATNAHLAAHRGYPSTWPDITPHIAIWPLTATGQPWSIVIGTSTAEATASPQWVVDTAHLWQSHWSLPSASLSLPAETPAFTPLRGFAQPDAVADAELLAQDAGQAWATHGGGFITPAARYWAHHNAHPESLEAAYQELGFACNEDALILLEGEYPSLNVYQLAAPNGIALHLSNSAKHPAYLVYHLASPGSGSFTQLGVLPEHQTEIDALLKSAARLGTLRELLNKVPRVTSEQLRGSDIQAHEVSPHLPGAD